MIVGGRVRKIVINIFFIAYIIITIVTTFFLIKYNDFGVIELNDKLVVTSNKTNLNYGKWTLLIIKKNNKSLKVNDDVFYYTGAEHKVLVSKNRITGIEDVEGNEKTIALSSSEKYSINYIIGKTDNLVKIPIVGLPLMVLTSKMGYLIAIVLPILGFFLFQIRSLIKRK